jgi:hypothetical protein
MKQFTCALLALAFGGGAVYIDLYHAKNHKDLIALLTIGCMIAVFGVVDD